MAGKIPEEKIQEVLRANDIKGIVSEYLDLERSGKNYRALCPFHDENTPSFTVDDRKQLFHCFGCKESGNVIQFVQKIEGIHFLEALRELAERGGVSLPDTDGDQQVSREPLYKANEWAVNFFKNQLWKTDEGKNVREYLKERGFTRETTLNWNLGYAPDEWEELLTAARDAGFSNEQLEKAGLVRDSRKGSGHYDYFRNRLIFPIRNLRGRVVGFGGRVLPDADSDRPKYLNTDDGPVFKKGRLLYGWDRRDRKQVRDNGLWIAEGYTDVIMAHQYGFKNVVASLGTALGEEHVKTLRSRVDEVTLMFDADEAGQNASERSLRLFLEEDTTLRIAEMPPDEDPCSLLEEDREQLKNVVEDATELIDYRIESAREKHDLSTVDGKVAAAREVLETVRGTSSTMRKQLVLQRIAELLSLDESVVRRTLSRMEQEGPGSTSSTPVDAANPETEEGSVSGLERAVRLVLGTLVHHTERARYVLDLLEPEDVPIRPYRTLFSRISNKIREEGDIVLGDLLHEIERDELRERLIAISFEVEEFEGDQVNRILEESVNYLQKYTKQNQIDDLRRQMKKAYENGNRERYKELLDRVSKLQKSIHGSTSETTKQQGKESLTEE